MAAAGAERALFGHDSAVEEPDPGIDPVSDPGGDDYLADRGQWKDLKGPTPRGLRRSRWLDRLGWYEVRDRDATLTSTRQVVATNPALIRSQPPFSGGPVGIDEQTGMYVGSDPFVLYDLDIVESINVVIVGDVGVARSSFVKIQTTICTSSSSPAGQVCCFDRKKNADDDSKYDGVARIFEASGKVARIIRFDRAGNGARSTSWIRGSSLVAVSSTTPSDHDDQSSIVRHDGTRDP